MKVKDLINIGIFSAIYFVITTVIAMLGFIPIFLPLLAVLVSLLGGVPFMLFLTKVKTFGMIWIMSVIMGIMMLLTGMSWPPLAVSAVTGLLAELIYRSGRYKSTSKAVLTCGVFSMWVAANYLPLFLSVGAIMVLALVILLTKVDENRFVSERIALEKEYGIEDEVEDDGSGDAKLPADVKRSLIFLLLSVAFWFMAYNGVTTAFSKYATETWGMGGGSYAGAMMLASIGALIAFIPVGIISSKLGRKKVILFGVILLALSWAAAFLFKSPNSGIYVVFILVGIAWASINVNSYPMVVEMCKGSDIGKFTGYYYTFSMAAQVFTPILSGFFLEHIGYWTLFPYATIFSVVAFVTMLQVKHGDSKPEAPKKGVEAFEDLDM